ncbi:MAG: 50S ribosomal protein L13 [Deltaproteobacteria bacterium]|nr:50S ribosomal protein L13 [Deltaproteobacteria bacterium]
MQKSSMTTKEEAVRNWVIVDLNDKILGRAASRIAILLRGKHKPSYTPYIDDGDFVVAINASKIRLTGKKLDDKMYYNHSGYRGGLKEITAGKLLEKKPEELLLRAVYGMLPKNKMNQHLMKKLKIYAGAEHPHSSQQPKTIEI